MNLLEYFTGSTENLPHGSSSKLFKATVELLPDDNLDPYKDVDEIFDEEQ